VSHHYGYIFPAIGSFPFLACTSESWESLGTLILVHSCVIVLHCIPNMTHYQLDSFRAKCSDIKGYDQKHSNLLSNNYIKTTNKITANKFSKTIWPQIKF